MSDEAILAPVPADLLQDALDNGFARVAFGSMAWDFFRRLSDEVGDEQLPVLLYASHETEFALEVAWAGGFAGWRDAAEAEGDPDFKDRDASELASLLRQRRRIDRRIGALLNQKPTTDAPPWQLDDEQLSIVRQLESRPRLRENVLLNCYEGRPSRLLGLQRRRRPARSLRWDGDTCFLVGLATHDEVY
ncbi:hypothetical protein BH24CHL6_BH24CHL6_02850 [soil metagenome]